MQRTSTSLPYTELEVADGNFDTNRSTIDRIVLHTMVGTWQGAAERFDNPASEVSAHYGIKYDGGIIHWLEETYTAYHAGNYAMNKRSIGIEHEDMGRYNDPRPDALYKTSAQLVADICRFYKIPCDRAHILDHRQVINTACPDALDTDRIIKEAQALINLPIPIMNIDAAHWISLTTDRRNEYGWSLPEHVYATVASLEANIEQLEEAITRKDKQVLSLQTEVKATQAHCDADCQQKLSNERTNMLVDFSVEKKILQSQIDDLKQNGVPTPFESPLRDRFHGKTLGEKINALVDILQA